MDIKCRIGGLKPDAVVMVATIRALKMHGGCIKEELDKEEREKLEEQMLDEKSQNELKKLVEEIKKDKLNTAQSEIDAADKMMKEENKAVYNGEREMLIFLGFAPCGNCHP